jgi:hypothetical protein
MTRADRVELLLGQPSTHDGRSGDGHGARLPQQA